MASSQLQLELFCCYCCCPTMNSIQCQANKIIHSCDVHACMQYNHAHGEHNYSYKAYSCSHWDIHRVKKILFMINESTSSQLVVSGPHKSDLYRTALLMLLIMLKLYMQVIAEQLSSGDNQLATINTVQVFPLIRPHSGIECY